MSDIAKAPRVTRQESAPWEPPAAGTWHWYTHEEHYDEKYKHLKKPRTVRTLVCVTRVGSNYVGIQAAASGTGWRVHFDNLEALEPAPDAADYIASKVAHYQQETRRLLGEVRALTGRLAIPTDDARALPETGGVTQALAVRTGDAVPRYKAELTKAKDETLPDLFKQIRDTNECAARWMKAELLPLEADLDGLRGATDAIKARIFNVELYAGLSEEMTEIRAGTPAPIDTPTHLFQRRHYMDEECLARYEAGGMDFRDIAAFDAWLLRPENISRLLPFPRCIVAFRVRRHRKDYTDEIDGDISRFIRIVLGDWDKMNRTTFLYIRNGEQVHRLNTEIEFNDPLFPDADHQPLNDAVLYFKDGHHGKNMTILTEGEYEGRCAEWKRAEAAYLASEKAKEDKRKRWGWRDHGDDPAHHYTRLTPDSVYYDDVTKEIARRVEEHNRLVLVLQGLFDRSPALHPHPPYKLWTGEDFARAVVPVYEDSRGLSTGAAPPDFEEYRRRLNATLKVGDHTVGQDDAWQEREAVKENDRRARSWHERRDYNMKRFTPYGNPGPGEVARVEHVGKAGALFKWYRERRRETWRHSREDNISCAITVPLDRLLNVSAYTPGDYRIFFDDPRTRAAYLKWAPLLLEAENWHAKKPK